jgi:hypothetical protein
MKPLMKRRTVYAATIVTMLVMVGGFALASGIFQNFGSTTVKGNQGAVTTTSDTIYSSGLTKSVFTQGTDGSGGACSTPLAYSPANDSGFEIVTNSWVQGGPGACNNVADYVMQIQFASAATLTAGAYSDTFSISSEFGSASAYTTSTVTITCTLTGSENQCGVIINIDTGIAANMPQPGLEALDITVTGS